jgi:hypothetical protein
MIPFETAFVGGLFLGLAFLCAEEGTEAAGSRSIVLWASAVIVGALSTGVCAFALLIGRVIYDSAQQSLEH